MLEKLLNTKPADLCLYWLLSGKQRALVERLRFVLCPVASGVALMDGNKELARLGFVEIMMDRTMRGEEVMITSWLYKQIQKFAEPEISWGSWDADGREV